MERMKLAEDPRVWNGNKRVLELEEREGMGVLRVS